MIVIKLMGGLGNQMFQYALGRALALRLNTKLKFETSGFEDDFYKREYKLDCFNLRANFIESEKLERLLKAPANLPSKMIRRVFNVKSYSQINEKGFNFNTTISEVPCNAYLIGYWQSEKYFIKYKNTLMNDFVFKQVLEGRNIETARVIENRNSVSIHFRRLHGISKTGNTDSNAINFHGASPMEYYNRAISLIIEKIEHPHFFVFSDDPKFAQEHLKLNHPITFITNNDDEHCYNDMRLMSLCKHHIIANSSFSWWGAWLAENPDKIVIAPREWFKDKSMNTSDLIPEGWNRI